MNDDKMSIDIWQAQIKARRGGKNLHSRLGSKSFCAPRSSGRVDA